VPAQECFRRNEQRAPAPARQQTTGGGQQRSIGAPQDRTPNLAAQDRKLVAEYDDLKLLEPLRTTAQQHQLDELPQGEVEQRGEQARIS
jgi:hypothetical protein